MLVVVIVVMVVLVVWVVLVRFWRVLEACRDARERNAPFAGSDGMVVDLVPTAVCDVPQNPPSRKATCCAPQSVLTHAVVELAS